MGKITCDRNCEKCRFKDCIMNDLTLEEYAFSRQLDKEVIEESTIHDYGVGSRQNRKPYDVKYFSTHKKEHLQRCKEYRDTHKEERKELYKKYYENNKEEINERARQRYQDNLEEQRLRKRLYYQQHKEEINRKRRERRTKRVRDCENQSAEVV